MPFSPTVYFRLKWEAKEALLLTYVLYVLRKKYHKGVYWMEGFSIVLHSGGDAILCKQNSEYLFLLNQRYLIHVDSVVRIE